MPQQCLPFPLNWSLAAFLLAALVGLPTVSRAGLGDQLRKLDPAVIASEARKRGNAEKGAIVFYTSAAACSKCHASGDRPSPLGPNIAQLGADLTDEYIIESLLHPSRAIRKGYETTTLMTESGRVVSGLIVRENESELVLRELADLNTEITLSPDEVEAKKISEKSLMPSGLVDTLGPLVNFLDLAAYLMEVRDGGTARAESLRPSVDVLLGKDDTKDLDHAGIIRGLNGRSIRRGRNTYLAQCANCHGQDGNTPSLATARAFGSQRLKFGADPHSMFRTLSHGNGLMAAATYLSPRERYEVVHFIRETFMKASNPDYKPVTEDYLASLPKGTRDGEFEPPPDREYGPALASQLGNEIPSALTIDLGGTTISYNLHTLDTAGVWKGGFLDVDQTQHKRGRGEGYAQPRGEIIPELSQWQWGHDGAIDYPTTGLLPRGPLPTKWLDYHGHFLHSDVVVLSYAIDGREVFEMPQQVVGQTAIRRTLTLGPGPEIAAVSLAPPAGAAGRSVQFWDQTAVVPLDDGRSVVVTLDGDRKASTLTIDSLGRIVVGFPESNRQTTVGVTMAVTSDAVDREMLKSLPVAMVNPSTLTAGGPARWDQTFPTVGYRGLGSGPYVVDTITIPESTPWNTWFRTSCLAFFPDGRMAVGTLNGDVWIVSGIDDDLTDISWRRFAGGLYEPMGIDVFEGQVYVCGRDRITRLHDLNDDGEADFYESFSADDDVSAYYHAFNFGLQRDSRGYLYYAKSGQYTSYAEPGAVIRVSPDGKSREVYATGFRTPNGLGMLPGDRLTVSDNQGNWMPASKVSLVERGGFYGLVQTSSGGDRWAPDGGRIDHTKVRPPETFDQPFIWMPQHVDNSSGGQVYVDDKRWGPLSGRLLHTSFGQSRLFTLHLQEVDGQTQAALVAFPQRFETGIMRGRVNPIDGQVYVTGLNGWNSNGTFSLTDNGISRVRYTGNDGPLVLDAKVTATGLRITVNQPLDRSSATDVTSYDAEQWNYRWTRNYGSDMYKPSTGEVGTDVAAITSASLSEDGRVIDLTLPGLAPVDNLDLKLNVETETGQRFEETVLWTIHSVPADDGSITDVSTTDGFTKDGSTDAE